MLKQKLSRREMLRHSGMAVLGTGMAGLIGCSPKANNQEKKEESTKTRPFRISLNTSTIQGFQLPVDQQIELCAKAGFDGIELWVRDVEAYIKQGGTPESLAGQLKKAGLVLENMIGFSTWIADDADKRKEGKESLRHDMELAARLGSKYIAAPVQGISSIEREKLPVYADRYREIIEMGDQTGVTPILELWGAGALNQLSDATAIAIGTSSPKATLLLDFYHLYRGGNSFSSLKLLNGSQLPVFHINDYPAQPPLSELKDSDRVFPGDGICPFNEAIPILYKSGFRGAFSIELFNKSYWKTMDVHTVLKNSYEKTAKVIDATID